jgi:hypothetical protein
MRPEEPLAASSAILVNNRAFVNSNGWPFGLLVSPQPPQSLPAPPPGAPPPPAWLGLGAWGGGWWRSRAGRAGTNARAEGCRGHPPRAPTAHVRGATLAAPHPARSDRRRHA